MSEMIKLQIDGIDIEVPRGTIILDAAKKAGIKIPTLCYLKDIHAYGICRMCVVEIEGRANLLAACVLEATHGMKIRTNTPQILRARKSTLELILSNHVKDCLACERNTNCELQSLSSQFVVDSNRFEQNNMERVIDTSSVSVVRDSGKCVLCRRCISVCQHVQDVFTIGEQERGSRLVIAPAFEGMGEAVCVNCGQCALVCPVNAIYEKHDMKEVEDALHDPSKYVVVQTAPAIRAALGEALGMEPGTNVTKKMVTALKLLGFNDVFDTNFTADLTILEEGTELLGRLRKALVDKDKKIALPMLTSCSPGWVKFLEHFFPDQTDNLSTAKSPHQMLGAIIKTYYAKKKNIDPSKIVSVSIMPCTAKKFDALRPEMRASGFQDVDYVLTTRELGKLIQKYSIDFPNLHDSEFDDPLGRSSGAADIFANSGGVMEAALRTVYELVTGRELPGENLHVANLMNIKGIREKSITFENCLPDYAWLNGVTLNVAATSGLGNARKVMDKVKEGNSPFHFIEIMACPGGCIGGGGQPRPTNDEIRKLRFQAILKEDEGKTLRKSHENPSIKMLYDEFLEKPNSHIAHELLHTHYVKRGIY